MRVYIAHSREMDYLNELYLPIRNDESLKDFEIILPHEKTNESNSREFYKSIDIFIAECSYAATGLGIELGWAFDDRKKIYCLFKKGRSISGSIKSVTDNIIEYKDTNDLLSIIKNILK